MVSAKAIGRRRRKAVQQVVKECISKSLKIIMVIVGVMTVSAKTIQLFTSQAKA